MDRYHLEKCIKAIEGFPPLPFSLNKLLCAISNEAVGAPEVAQIIGMDQSLTANVLKLINSSYYGYSARISNISHAVVLLGMDTIKNLAISLSVINVMTKDTFNDPGRIFYWEHAIGTAIAARQLMSDFNKNLAEETFTAGLLHDVGKMVFLISLDDQYVMLFKEALMDTYDISAFEEEYIGIDHARIGASLVRRWNFPIELQYLIRYHHEPEELKKYAMRNILLQSCVVYVANWISKLHVFEMDLSECKCHKFHHIKSILKISDTKIGEVLEFLVPSIDELRHFFGIR
ncbi:MAG: HDOD domain-containing protein [Candidatus Auribacterota bacterium]|nr:HDOD domain-containing protein [Candidatus Auribacterota bacterium]